MGIMLNYHSAARRASVAASIGERILRLRGATKSINEIARDFENALENAVVDVVNGNMTRAALAALMRELIIDSARAVFVEGMKEGDKGLTEADIDDEDEAVIREWILSQVRHINDFADAVAEAAKLKGDERTEARNALLKRVELWVEALRGLGLRGTASAKGNMMVTWRYGDTEHCDTCRSLNGKRRRLKWFTGKGYIPREPGSATLDCNGYNCQCQLVDDRGSVVL